MRHLFLLIALFFTGFMCCKSRSTTNSGIAGTITVDNGGYGGASQTSTAESLEVSRARFKKVADECKAVILNRNGSPEVITPLNPVRDILNSKQNLPEQ